MEDEKIMKNMKEALKRTKKRGRKHKHQSSKGNSSIDEELGDKLMKNWVFSSPPMTESKKDVKIETLNNTKINAFDRLMSKRTEPLSPISPEINGVKSKKPKKLKRHSSMKSNQDDEENNSMDNNSKSIKKFFNGNSTNASPEVVVDEIGMTRKRNRISEIETPIDITETNNKRRKTRREKVELDSNENVEEIPTTIDVLPIIRPRRSCAGKVNYELLLSPEKADVINKSSMNVVVIEDNSPKKSKKLAPLFVKKVPKPAIDPAVKEARRSFLLSGLPEDLRQTIDKQRQFENEISSNELVAFPIISHVGIKNIVGVDVIDSWKNSHIKLKNVDEHNENVKNFSTTTLFRGCLTDCYVNNGNSLQYQQTTNKNEKGAIKNLKEIVQQLKTEYGDFPTNRCFKQLHWKFKSFSKNSLSASDENSENFLYVDVLKPMKSEEFLINSKPAKELFNFLQTFNEKSESFEDFTDDSNSSRFSVRGSNNFVVLTGDNGVGKTSSVYAVTSDLNYRVIEVNAGSRRSGKIMLQELLEATQSHRVQTNNNNDNTQDSTSSQSQTSNEDKKSVILIEDAELVFESDDGFVSSIQQLINISKRPVILTTNNRNCQHLQKFINHNEIAYTMTDDDENRIGKYLSLLCLAANYRIDSIDIQHLFTSNRRDMRKTINEIEFFIRSRVTTKTTTTAKFFDDDDDDDDLLEFYLKDRRSATMRINQNHSNDDISSIHFDSSIMSSMLMPKSAKFDDEKKDELMDEMKCYILENTHSHMLKSKYNLNESIYKVTESRKSSSSTTIASHLISQSQNSTTTKRVLSTDYSPFLREMCRSEKMRFGNGRKASSNNRGHYLRFLIAQNSFGNEYFNENAELFQK